ncbi:MAG: D-glycero-beta-D-manno-heptose-7-phosphate kinase [Ignavibacteria bacterium]|nr:D-glycero-beta-D-manno-heptose-7-phosphate kinase [Ignavibacteria bacterium]
MENISNNYVEQLLDVARNKSIAVIGDVMLDQYYWGNVNRVSPEAPVPVVDIKNETFHLGGAANVAQNLESLGLRPFLFGLLGDDVTGEMFERICDNLRICHSGLYRDSSRVTTVKTRIIGNNQQIVRLDREIVTPISAIAEEYILSHIKELPDLDGIIFEDYDKGTLSKTLIRNVIDYARMKNIPVFVDPKLNNFHNYKDATVFKPNKKETESGLNISIETAADAEFAGEKLLKEFGMENVLITLGSDGMMLFTKDGEVYSVPTVARKVADVSGAGDTTIASLTALYIAGASLKEAATVANFAAGVVCEKPGIVAIERFELLEAIKRNV